MATAVFTGLDGFLSTVFEMLGSPLSLTVGESLVATVLTGILVILIGVVRPFADEDGRPRRWHPLLRFRSSALAASTIVAALLGYIGLARFMSQQIVITGAVLATMYIGFLSARAVSRGGRLRQYGARPPSRAAASTWTRRRSTSSASSSASPSTSLVVSDRPAADPVPVGLPAGRHHGLGLPARHRDQHRLRLLLADRASHRPPRLRRRLFRHPLVPGLARRLGDGARPRRCGRAQLDPHCRRLCRRRARRADRRFGGRHRPFQPGADRRRSLARHRLRPAECRVEFRLRPHPARRAAVQGRRLDHRRRGLRDGQEDQRARDRDRDVPAPDGHPAQLAN